MNKLKTLFFLKWLVVLFAQNVRALMLREHMFHEPLSITFAAKSRINIERAALKNVFTVIFDCNKTICCVLILQNVERMRQQEN